MGVGLKAGLHQRRLGSGFGNKQTKMVRNPDDTPYQIKLALTRLARQIEPQEWGRLPRRQTHPVLTPKKAQVYVIT
jgi:hypothetical protein